MIEFFGKDLRVEFPLGGTNFESSGDGRDEIRWEEPDNRFVTRVACATLTLHIPARRETDCPAVLIFPGGGYRGVSLDKEGHHVAAWLGERGIVGAVLKYRLPDASKPAFPPVPFRDGVLAWEALCGQAGQWGIASDRMGVMGFSAGGHLAGSLALRMNEWDPAKRWPRPSFAALIYPVVTGAPPHAHAGSFQALVEGAVPKEYMEATYSLEELVGLGSPPLFLFHARDDASVPPANSELLYAAARAAGVESVLSLSVSGGHGFGLGRAGTDSGKWGDEFVAWLAALPRRD